MSTRPRFSVFTRRNLTTGHVEYLFQDHDKKIEDFPMAGVCKGVIIPTFMDGRMPIYNAEDAITVCDMLNALHDKGVAL